MKIIGAGLGKTGTTSLAAALKILGFKVFDFPEHVTLHRKQWFDLYFHGVEPDFAAMYEDVDAVTDVLPAYWFEEILKCFPDAKVILTVRDSEDVWVQSLVKHFSLARSVAPRWYRVLPEIGKMVDFITALHNATYGGESPMNFPWYGKKYREHNERVQAVVPASQLLVFNVKEGWQPLCDFLGSEVPSQEFPRSNVAGSDLKGNPGIRSMKRRAWSVLAVLVAVVSVIIFYLITRLF